MVAIHNPNEDFVSPEQNYLLLDEMQQNRLRACMPQVLQFLCPNRHELRKIEGPTRSGDAAHISVYGPGASDMQEVRWGAWPVKVAIGTRSWRVVGNVNAKSEQVDYAIIPRSDDALGSSPSEVTDYLWEASEHVEGMEAAYLQQKTMRRSRVASFLGKLMQSR